MPAFVTIDPSLKSFNGHFLTYDNVISREARANGFEPYVLAARSVASDLPCEFTCVPCFRLGLEETRFSGIVVRRIGFVRAADRASAARVFLNDLRAVRDRVRLDDGSVLFLHTTTYRQIVPAVEFLREVCRDADVRLSILLRYSVAPNPYYPQSPEAEEYRKALRYAETSSVRDRVSLVTDSDLLLGEYAALTSLPIRLVPIPHTLEEHAPKRPPATGRARTLTYLGNARSTKGFQYLPYALQAVHSELDAGTWTAEIQSNVMFKRDMESVAALCRLRKLPVRLHERELSLAEYEAMLKRADLVLLPYQILYYHSQTSGVLVEALGAGTPVIVPRGTWMARQIRGRDVGVTFLPGDRISFAAAVEEAMRDIERLQENACRFRAEWLQFHNPGSFMRHLLAAVRPA